MAIEFNITPSHRFFLGEDKVIDLTIFQQDGVTPLDVSGMTLEWSLKKKDKDPDPPIIGKATGSGITIVGVYNVNPATNTQRVRISFASADTDPFVTVSYTLKAGFAYRHSLKRTDTGSEGIFTFGSLTFLQATEQ